jgi:hypothetical protein
LLTLREPALLPYFGGEPRRLAYGSWRLVVAGERSAFAAWQVDEAPLQTPRYCHPIVAILPPTAANGSARSQRSLTRCDIPAE